MAYEQNIEVLEESKLTSSLSRNAVVDPDHIESPFEMNFEVSTLVGLGGTGPFDGFTIETVYKMRIGQLDFWPSDLPKHVLIQYWDDLKEAGLLEPYCYWLFRFVRPDEYSSWEVENSESLQQLIDWKADNGSRLMSKELNRLHSTIK